MFLKNSQKSKENNCARVSFLIKLQALGCNFIKNQTLGQGFSGKFYEIFRNTIFHRTPPMAASIINDETQYPGITMETDNQFNTRDLTKGENEICQMSMLERRKL